MQNDKKIQISLGASRKTSYWPEADMYWSEFVTRLKTPVRGPETLEEYLKESV